MLKFVPKVTWRVRTHGSRLDLGYHPRSGFSSRLRTKTAIFRLLAGTTADQSSRRPARQNIWGERAQINTLRLSISLTMPSLVKFWEWPELSHNILYDYWMQAFPDFLGNWLYPTNLTQPKPWTKSERFCMKRLILIEHNLRNTLKPVTQAWHIILSLYRSVFIASG